MINLREKKEIEILPNRNREGEGCKLWEIGNDTFMVFLSFWPVFNLLEGNLDVKNDDINFLETNQKNCPSTPWEIVNFSILTLFFHLSFPKIGQSSELKHVHFWTEY